TSRRWSPTKAWTRRSGGWRESGWRGSRRVDGATRLRRLDERIYVEAIGPRRLDSGVVALGVKCRRSREDPEVLPVRRSDGCPRIVVGQSEDPVVAPHEREEREEPRSEAHFQLRERLGVDNARDALRLGHLSVFGPAAVRDVDAAILAQRVAGANVASTVALETVGKARNLEPVAKITLEIDGLDGADRGTLDRKSTRLNSSHVKV